MTNRKPPSGRARLSLSTTDSTRIRWARGSLLFPASSALLHPPNLLCFQDIILLTHYPRHSRADCRQDEAFSKVCGLHFSKSLSDYYFPYAFVCEGIHGAHSFHVINYLRGLVYHKYWFVFDPTLQLALDQSRNSGCRLWFAEVAGLCIERVLNGSAQNQPSNTDVLGLFQFQFSFNKIQDITKLSYKLRFFLTSILPRTKMHILGVVNGNVENGTGQLHFTSLTNLLFLIVCYIIWESLN